MTEKRFTHEKWYDERKIKENGELFAIVDVYNQADTICNRLNELFDENEELKQSNDQKFWKRQCIEASNKNSIFAHELGIAIRQGYETSDAFKEYIEQLKKDNQKYQKLNGDVE